MNEDVVALVLVFGTFGWLVWVLFSSVRRYRMAKLRSDLQMRLIDKFGNGQEFVAYMQTGPGKELLARLSDDPLMLTGRILDAVQSAYLLTIVGVALLALRHWVMDGAEALLVFGVLAVALGLGFWASAWHTGSLARRFGVFPHPRDEGANPAGRH